MRVIGGHDYYDTAMAFGHDTSTVFARSRDATLSFREAEAIGFTADIRPFRLDVEDSSRREGGGRPRRAAGDCMVEADGGQHVMLGMAVLLCGTLYRGVIVRTRRGSSSMESFFWTRKALDAWASSLGIIVRPWGPTYVVRHVPTLDTHFASRSLSRAAKDMVAARRISVATLVPPDIGHQPMSIYRIRERTLSWRVNGDDLKAVQFWKVMDAYAAFQELDMWIGGVLPRPMNPMSEIRDDSVRIHKAGFDVRTSFRHRMESSTDVP